MSKKNSFYPLSLMLLKKFNIKNNKYLSLNKNLITEINNKNEQEKKLSISNNHQNQNYLNYEEPHSNTCFSYMKKNKIILNKVNQKKEEILNNKNNLKEDTKMLIIKKLSDTDKHNNSKSRNRFNEFSSQKSDNNYPTYSSYNYNSTASAPSNYSNRDNKTYYQTINKEIKEKNLFYKPKKIDKINNQIVADKIFKELLSLKTEKDIKSYYIKKDYAKAITEAENIDKNHNFNINNCIDPMTYIKFNLTNYPKNNNLFKSFDTQLIIFGNQKYRNDLLDGVNVYKNNCVKYEDLRGPIGFDKNQINEIKRNEIIKNMKMNYTPKKGLIFSNRLYKKKYRKKYEFEFDNNYKRIQNFLNKNIDKYETQIKFDKGKRVTTNIDKNDIKTLKKIDSNAELIKDKEEIIKFSHRFLSFDDKINKMLKKTRNTTNYLFKRAQHHHKIKKKIDELYENIYK